MSSASNEPKEWTVRSSNELDPSNELLKAALNTLIKAAEHAEFEVVQILPSTDQPTRLLTRGDLLAILDTVREYRPAVIVEPNATIQPQKQSND